jgi:hypothetical protein
MNGIRTVNIARSRGTEQPALCLLCPKPVGAYRNATFWLVTPEAPRPVHTIGGAICPACARLPDLNARAVAALKLVWPTARQIEVANAVGHA